MDYDAIFGQCRVALETYRVSKTLQVPVIFRGSVMFNDDLKDNNLLSIDGWVQLDCKWHRVFMLVNVVDDIEVKYIDGVIIK